MLGLHRLFDDGTEKLMAVKNGASSLSEERVNRVFAHNNMNLCYIQGWQYWLDDFYHGSPEGRSLLEPSLDRSQIILIVRLVMKLSNWNFGGRREADIGNRRKID